METTKTNAKLLSPVKVKPPDATSVFFGLAVVFSKELAKSWFMPPQYSLGWLWCLAKSWFTPWEQQW